VDLTIIRCQDFVTEREHYPVRVCAPRAVVGPPAFLPEKAR
jgi:hypothetical protein